MRAAVLREAGTPLVVEDVELRPVAPTEVRVRLAASGVCRSDLSAARGILFQMLPVVLGHEGAGVVVETGSRVSGLAEGDHVVLSNIAPCRRCASCLAGQPELCEHGMDHAFSGPYGRAGGDDVHAGFGTGTFGEETVVPADAAVRIDPNVPLDVAALIGCAVVTGTGAVLRSARVRPGETVAVIGCGGVGLAAVQGARLAGASRIVAVDRVPGKLAMAEVSGATHTVSAADVDPVEAVRELTGGRGVDHALEVVGAAATVRQAYDMTRRGGTVVVVGAAAPDQVVSLGVLQLMVDAKTVRGCLFGATDPHRDIPEVVRLHQAGLLDLRALVTRSIGVDDVDDAFVAMEAGDVARSVITYG